MRETKLFQKFEIGIVQNDVHLLDLVKRFPILLLADPYSDEYFLANISFDTAENEPRKVWITDLSDHNVDHMSARDAAELKLSFFTLLDEDRHVDRPPSSRTTTRLIKQSASFQLQNLS